MAKRKKPSSGGGRIPNTEPRIQTFKDFGGCNFQVNPRDFKYSFNQPDDIKQDPQSDLQMNFMVVQNNAKIAANKTIETREADRVIATAPEGTEFTDVCLLVGSELYIACTDKNVWYKDLSEEGTEMTGKVEIQDIDGEEKDNTWTCLGYADDSLVGLTAGKQMFTGPMGSHVLRNAKKVPDPEAIPFSRLKGVGIKISKTQTEECVFRIGLYYTRVNKYGPTLASPQTVIYASKPTTEWSGVSYLSITGDEPSGYDIKAVELYYVEGDYQDPAFLGRTEMIDGDGGSWNFNWTGYLFDTSMWTLANLTVPTENYTAGVPASKMSYIDGRCYFYGGDPDYRLWIGGNPGNRFSVSTGTGGGFCDVEPGSGQSIRVVKKFKTQSGSNIVTILCDNPNSSREHRHNLLENNITISNEQSAKGWQTEMVNGTVGCKSYYGCQVCADGLYAVSRYGLCLTTLTMEYNSQLKITYVSDPVEPAFVQRKGEHLSQSVLLYIADALYLAFGTGPSELDNVILCYDIGLKSWWTYTIDVDPPIVNMIQIDWEGMREGIGVVTHDAVLMIPTTELSEPKDNVDDDGLFPLVHIETGELSTTQPIQNSQHLTQIELRFDYFVGDLDVTVEGVDIFGRRIFTKKRMHCSDVVHQMSEYIRIDSKVESYRIVMQGRASFRLTHIMGKTYPLGNRLGIAYGFDSSQGHRSAWDIHPTFKNYNDIRDALIV